MILTGKAVVIPANPDAYLVVGDEKAPVLRVGSKRDAADLQEMADALNVWAGKL